MATEFSKRLKEIYRHHELQTSSLGQLNAAHAKLRKRKGSASIDDSHDPSQPLQLGTPLTLDEKTAEQLKLLYQNSFVTAAEEMKLISDCIERMKKFAQRRDTKDKKRKLEDQEAEPEPPPTPPPSTKSSSAKERKESTQSSHAKIKGDIWSHDGSTALPRGMEVAALVDADSNPRLWILATVMDFHSSPRPRYEVVDADPGDPGDDADGGNPMPRKKYMLPPKKILPLPTLEQIPMSKRREFARNQSVLALFPVGGITTFYPALVIKSPKQTKSDSYLLEFDEDDGEQREVDAHYVAPLLNEELQME